MRSIMHIIHASEGDSVQIHKKLEMNDKFVKEMTISDGNQENAAYYIV